MLLLVLALDLLYICALMLLIVLVNMLLVLLYLEQHNLSHEGILMDLDL